MGQGKFLSRLARTPDLVTDLLDGLATGVIIISLEGEIVGANYKALEILGISGGEAIGKPVWKFIPSLDDQAIKAILSAPALETISTKVYPPEGRPISVFLKFSVLRGEDYPLAIVVNVMEKKEELKEAVSDEARRLLLLNRIAKAAAYSLDPEKLAEAIYQEIITILEADVFYLAIYYPQTRELDSLLMVDAGVREPRIRTKLDSSISEWVITNKKPLLITNMEKEKGRYSFRVWGTGKIPLSYLAVPVMTEDEVVGIISVQSYRPNAYDEKDVELLSTVASQAALSIRNALLHQQEKKRATQLALINEVTRCIATTLEPEQLLAEVVKAIQEKFGYYGVAILLVEGQYAVLKAVSGGYASLIEGEYRQPLSEGIIGWAITHGETVLSNNVEEDPRYIPGPVPKGVTRSELCVPLKFRKRVIGALDIQSKEAGAFNHLDTVAMEALASQIAIALHNARLYERVKQTLGLLFTAANNIQDEALLVASDYTIIDANAKVLEHLGLSREQIRGRRCYEVFYGQDSPCPEEEQRPCYIRRVLAEKKPIYLTYEEKPGPRGEKRYLEIMASPIFSEKGEVSSIVVIRHDITDRIRLQERLEAIRKLGRELVMAASEDEIIEAILDAAEKMLKYNAVAFLAVDEEKNELYLKAIRGYPMPEKPVRLPLDGEKGITVAVARSGEPIYVPDVTKDPRFVKGYPGLVTRSEMDVPVKVRGKVVGVINVEDEEVGAFTREDILLLSALAEQAGIALENVQLRKDLERKLAELESLFQASAALTSTLEPEKLLEEILSTAIEIIPGAEKGSILLVDEQTGELTIQALVGYSDPRVKEVRFPRTEGYSAKAMREGKPLLIPDARADPEIRYNGDIEEIRAIKSAIVAPLQVKGHTIGIISLDNTTRTGAFTEDDLHLLSIFASHAAAAIENAHLFRAEQEQRELAQALAEAAIAVSSTLDINEVLDRILDQVQQVVAGDAFNVMLLVPGEDKARVVRWRGYERFGVEDQIAGLLFQISKYPNLMKMVETGDAVLIPDTAADPEWVKLKGWEWLRSYVAAPLRVKGATLGFLCVDGTKPGQFTPADAWRLKAFAANAATAIQNALLAKDLAQSEARYRLLSEANLAGVYLIQDGRFRYVNPALASMFGYEVDEIIGRLGPIDLTAPEDRDLVAENVRKRLEGEMKSIRYRFRGLRKDGTIIHCEAHGSATEYEGRPAILGTIMDVTAQVKAEEETLRRARELEALNRLAQALATTLELEGMAEKAGQVLMEITEADALAFHIFEGEGQGFVISKSTGFRPVPIPATEEQLKELEESPDSPIFVEDLSLISYIPDFVRERGFTCGAFFPIHLWGRKAGFVSLLYREPRTYTEEDKNLLEAISKQISVAIEKALLYREVVQAQEEWESTFNAITDGIFIVDEDFTILRANEALAKRVNLSPQEIVGKKCYELIHHTDAPPSWCPHIKALKEGHPLSEEVEEPSLKGTFLISAYPVFDDEGKAVASSLIIKDITREKEMQERLFQAEKLASLGELISGVAHELNNPLTSVLGYAQLLAANPSLPDHVKRDLKRIEEQANRAAGIVRNLLDFARKRPPRREPVDINKLVKKTLELRAYEMRVENIKLITDLAPGLPMTMADPQQIQQVFLNIIINAEQAMAEAHGSGTLRVKTSLTPENYIRVEFSDDGPGIPRENLSRIFDPFFTTKEKGTGMGLAIAYGFVAEHKGRIWAKNNTPYPGVTFYVELPVIQPEEATSWAEEYLKAIREKEGVTPASILIVDDETSITDLLSTILSQEGYKVTTTGDGERAFRLLQEHKFDLVITDIKMPKMGGRTLFERVKKENPDLARRFIFITGDVMEASTQAFLARTGLPYLTKPFTVQRVKEVVRDALERFK